ncbi:MAG: HAD family hydrolase [Actinomycetota bacterium]
MQLRALSFDADQTLWDFHGVQRRALEATAQTMIDRELVPTGAVDASTLQAAREEIIGQYRGRPHSLEDVRRASFEHVLDRVGCVDSGGVAHELLDVFLQVRFNEIELYPEVRGCLDRLGSRYRLGLLSNGNTDPERCGLAGVFQAVVLTPSLGVDKPHPEAFATLTRQLGVDPAATAHVGDDWDDVEGANASGMRSVYLNRNGANPPFRACADHEIRSLTDLETLLESE